MERIDKIISNMTEYSRNDVKKLISKRLVLVNGNTILSSSFKVDPLSDVIEVNGNIIKYEKYVYLLLNKPKGYVSATVDNMYPTVIDLVPSKYQHRRLFPVGRLDKDTTGLIIITDDGEFAHEILSPSKHISKKYYVVLSGSLYSSMVNEFKEGLIVGNTRFNSSILEIIDSNSCFVTLTEGKYHEIKRMFSKYKLDVIELKRVSMGNLLLPSDLLEGECRAATEHELDLIKGVN